MKHPAAPILVSTAALLWAIPFAWMAVASLRPDLAGEADVASLLPVGPFSLANLREAWSSGHFPLWYCNTVLLCAGILAVQCVTVSLAGYAFARLRFRGREWVFAAFLVQIGSPVISSIDFVTPTAQRQDLTLRTVQQ